MGSLSKQVAIVTGASAGIGRSIAIAFAREGASVVLAARRREKLEQLAGEIAESGGTALCVPTDVTSEEQVLQLFRTTADTYGHVDILVNNAGTAVGKATDEMTLAEWKHVIDCNLTGAFLCSREALKLMKPRRSGRILNIGSTSAKVPRANSAPYTSSKYALEGLTHSLAVDGRQHGIAASVLQPGNVVTDIWRGGAEQIMKREGAMSPEDLARIALLMVTLPADLNLYQALVLPLSMPFLGRG
jgi:NAD(P)-dependent dehydrogenase (short-subunit alcohol dehydrogenase family)